MQRNKHHRRILRWAITFASVFRIDHPAIAQKYLYGDIEGEVRLRSSGGYRPSPDGAVFAEGDWETPEAAVVNGRFRIPNVPLGIYFLKALKEGFRQNGVFRVRVLSDTTVGITDPPRYLPLVPGTSPSAESSRGGLEGRGRPRIQVVLFMEPQPGVGMMPEPMPDSPCPDFQIHIISETGPVGGAEAQALYQRGAQMVVLDRKESDVNGCVALSVQLPAGVNEYIMTVFRPGFRQYSELIGRNRTPPAEVRLTRRSPLSAITPEPDETAAVDTLDTSRRRVFSGRILEDLPLGGIRTFDALALLAPGVAPPPATVLPVGPGVSAGIGTAGQFAVNGLRSRENNFAVDGSDNNDEDVGVRRQGFVSPTPQSIESLQEFQIITAQADATFGRNIGAQVNAVSKSGGARFHGALYGFGTNQRLNARDFFDFSPPAGPRQILRASTGKPVLLDAGEIPTVPSPAKDPLTLAQSGFVLGGPVRTRRDRARMFVFTSLERQDRHAARDFHFAVPTVKERGFLETGETGWERAGKRVFPASFPGNAIFSLYPFPNDPLGPYGANTYTTQLPANGEGTLGSAKVDRKLSPFGRQHLLTARYSIGDEDSILPVTGGALFSSVAPGVRTQNAASSLNSELSGRTNNVFRVSYGRTAVNFLPATHPYLLDSAWFPGTPFLLNAPLLLNLSDSGDHPRFVSASGSEGERLLSDAGYGQLSTGRQRPVQTEDITGPIGQVTVAGFSPIGLDVSAFPQRRANNTFQIGDTIRHVHGNHIWSLGFDIRHNRINSRVERNSRPSVVFHGLRNFSEIPDSAPASTDFLTGATMAAAGAPTGFFHTLSADSDRSLGLRFSQINFFVQDEVRLGAALRLNWGLRFELNTAPHTSRGRLETAFDREKVAKQAQEECRLLTDNNKPCEQFEGELRKYLPI